MAKLQLTFASALYDRMQPIYTGEVPVDGIDLNFIRIEQPRPIFDRMSGGQEFDVAEYSSSEYIQRYANKHCPFVAIPVFPSRCFRHAFIGINRESGITKPKDLAGKRIGVALYTMTAAIFIRGLLQHEYGVDFSNVTWVQGAINDKGSHGAPTVLPLLKPIKIEQGPPNKSLDDLIQEGAIDATMGTSMPESFRTNPNVARLFPNFVELEKEYYKRTKIYPIMHLVAIKKSIYEKYPFVATSLFNAFQRAKEIALTRMYNERALRYMLPWLPRDIDEIHEFFDGDPWPYGVEENRPTLEALVTYLCDQNLIAKPVPLEELFAPIRGLG
jgi:4,5-dihydroxyphthalate decarboxylase